MTTRLSSWCSDVELSRLNMHFTRRLFCTTSSLKTLHQLSCPVLSNSTIPDVVINSDLWRCVEENNQRCSRLRIQLEGDQQSSRASEPISPIIHPFASLRLHGREPRAGVIATLLRSSLTHSERNFARAGLEPTQDKVSKTSVLPNQTIGHHRLSWCVLSFTMYLTQLEGWHYAVFQELFCLMFHQNVHTVRRNTTSSRNAQHALNRIRLKLVGVLRGFSSLLLSSQFISSSQRHSNHMACDSPIDVGAPCSLQGEVPSSSISPDLKLLKIFITTKHKFWD